MFTFLQLISWIGFYELSHLKQNATLANNVVCYYEPERELW